MILTSRLCFVLLRTALFVINDYSLGKHALNIKADVGKGLLSNMGKP